MPRISKDLVSPSSTAREEKKKLSKLSKIIQVILERPELKFWLTNSQVYPLSSLLIEPHTGNTTKGLPSPTTQPQSTLSFLELGILLFEGYFRNITDKIYLLALLKGTIIFN